MGSKSSEVKMAWIVDSSQYYRRFETEYVAKASKGCTVEALNIEQALKEFNRNNYPDVLIIDIIQPKINTIKLVNYLKDKKPEMSIIVCSAEAKRNSKNLIGMTLISKPIVSMSLFMQTVKEIIENV